MLGTQGALPVKSQRPPTVWLPQPHAYYRVAATTTRSRGRVRLSPGSRQPHRSRQPHAVAADHAVTPGTRAAPPRPAGLAHRTVRGVRHGPRIVHAGQGEAGVTNPTSRPAAHGNVQRLVCGTLCRARADAGTLWQHAPYTARLEDSPSPVYGAALLMRFGGNTIRGSNPRSSALGVGIYRTRMRFACGGRSGLVRAGCTHEALTGSARAPMALAGIWLASWNYGGSRFGCAPRDFRERCDVGLVGERGPAMAEQRADVLGAQDGGLTARKRVRDADIW